MAGAAVAGTAVAVAAGTVVATVVGMAVAAAAAAAVVMAVVAGVATGSGALSSGMSTRMKLPDRSGRIFDAGEASAPVFAAVPEDRTRVSAGLATRTTRPTTTPCMRAGTCTRAEIRKIYSPSQ